MICFTVPGALKGKGRPRFARSGNRIITYTPPDTVAYENLIAAKAKEAMRGQRPMEGGVYLTVAVDYPVPKSWSEKKKIQALIGGIVPTVKPDVDNILKVVSDALNGVAWKDDAQVIWATVKKKYGMIPGIEVTVS